jgi:hypothetical protein
VPASEATLSTLPALEATVTLSNVRRWTIIALLFASAVINFAHRAAVSVALPMISRDLKLSPLQKGWLLYSFFVSYALMQFQTDATFAPQVSSVMFMFDRTLMEEKAWNGKMTLSYLSCCGSNSTPPSWGMCSTLSASAGNFSHLNAGPSVLTWWWRAAP